MVASAASKHIPLTRQHQLSELQPIWRAQILGHYQRRGANGVPRPGTQTRGATLVNYPREMHIQMGRIVDRLSLQAARGRVVGVDSMSDSVSHPVVLE